MSDGKGRSGPVFLIGALLAMVLVIGWVYQYGAYQKEIEVLQHDVDRIQVELAKLKIVREKMAALDKETIEKELTMERARAKVPVGVDADAFMDEFKVWVADAGKTVNGYAYESVKKGGYAHEIRFTVEVEWGATSAQAVYARSLEDKRIIHWSEESLEGGFGAGPMNPIIYGFDEEDECTRERRDEQLAAESARTRSDQTPDVSKSKVWLWPYKGRIARMNEELTRAKNQADGFGQERIKLEYLQCMQDLLDKYIRFITTIVPED